MIPIVLGVYESQKAEKVGAGTTRQTTDLRILWFAAQMPGGDIACQPLTDQHLPSGFVQPVNRDVFLSGYHPVPQVYEDSLRGVVNALRDRMNGMDSVLAVKALPREEAMLFRGLMAFLHVKPDIQPSDADMLSVRTMLDAMRQTKNLVFEYQRVITDAAIELRKKRNFEAAVTYYQKALVLDSGNDHIMFNLARAYFEMGKINEARGMLYQALEVNPELEVARRFLRYLDASSAG